MREIPPQEWEFSWQQISHQNHKSSTWPNFFKCWKDCHSQLQYSSFPFPPGMPPGGCLKTYIPNNIHGYDFSFTYTPIIQFNNICLKRLTGSLFLYLGTLVGKMELFEHWSSITVNTMAVKVNTTTVEITFKRLIIRWYMQGTEVTSQTG